MNIAFDAKRAFHNSTGLGHYSRTLIRSLSVFYPEHEYFLFNPKPGSFELKALNIHEVLPNKFFHKLFSGAWRSSWVKQDLPKYNVDIYHGLSHEIPMGIQKTGIPSVVTIHDLIHERFPEQYNPIDVKIYDKKFRYACEHADLVIAISEQTKQDIIHYYQTPAEKIRVCHQSCNPMFGQTVDDSEKKSIQKKYQLPDHFFLYVGSIIERKNLLNICKAMFMIRNEVHIPLVVIGNGGKYKEQVKDFIRQNGLENKIIFLSETKLAQTPGFKTATDFPAIYQLATALIYPSFFEGFGIPVLEALWSRTPVITSNRSSLPEAGGDGAYYVDPESSEDISIAMKDVLRNRELANSQIEKGWVYAQKFTQLKCAEKIMRVYQELVK
jgi:glycosyltransferase involved in cell wall biosynthesis